MQAALPPTERALAARGVPWYDVPDVCAERTLAARGVPWDDVPDVCAEQGSSKTGWVTGRLAVSRVARRLVARVCDFGELGELAGYHGNSKLGTSLPSLVAVPKNGASNARAPSLGRGAPLNHPQTSLQRSTSL